MDSHSLPDYSIDQSAAEQAAQRILIAALEGGVVSLDQVSTNASEGTDLGEFLGAALVALTAKIKGTPEH